jgi:integrase
MATTDGKLTVQDAAGLADPGMYADGNGLYLQVNGAASKSWIYRYSLRGKAREMGLGSLREVSLADARGRAAEARALARQGIDPIATRHAALARQREAAAEAKAAAADSITFKAAAEAFIAGRRAGWRNIKHKTQWENTLATYAYPSIGALPVRLIDTAALLAVLRPIWQQKPETAGRLRGRIERILDAARIAGHRTGENPARWRGHLEAVLPKQAAIRAVAPLAAMPYAEIGAFMAELRGRAGIAARALEFTILCASRSGETAGARWSEIDLRGKLWTIAAERMKGGSSHRVPLSTRAVEILQALPRQGELVFESPMTGRRLSENAMLKTLEDMGRRDVTVHGFRSTFRSWAATHSRFYPSEVVEAALARGGSARAAAIQARSDFLEQRRLLMEAWAKFATR